MPLGAVHPITEEIRVEGMAATFSGKTVAEPPVSPADVEKLHAKIGELLVERDFLRDASARLGVIRGGR